jgi:predicted phosphodiesterase/pyruvate-formate lyase-activating enzyme
MKVEKIMQREALLFEGPTIFFGGPYSNQQATEALLSEARRLQIPPERIVCTGDVIAYCGNPEATAELVRSSGIHVVMGNCEESLAAAAGDCGCGFTPGSACDRLSTAWFSLADREIGAGLRTWMAQLPRRIDVEIGGSHLAVVHGGVERINRFIYASSAAAIKRAELDLAGVDGIIGGDCGIPFTQTIHGMLWHNPGAIGMPANDGTPRVWYSVLTPLEDGLHIEHAALEYDYQAAATSMRRTGLPEDYATCLSSGIWPSCDSLPFREIRETGVPLTPGRVTISGAIDQRARSRRVSDADMQQLWPSLDRRAAKPLDPEKFQNPEFTADGSRRAQVELKSLATLWFNTGTLCNVACRNCYIESGPRNDRLAYLTRSEVSAYLDEIDRDELGTEEIGFTGGEPFMNPDIFGMLEDSLGRGFRVLVLTNAMRPMQRSKAKLLELRRRFGDKLSLRISLDHFSPERHEDERGAGTFAPTLDGLVWLSENGFNIGVSGRTMWGESPDQERAGYARLFADQGIEIDLDDPRRFILFPEMDKTVDVPEITTDCWRILGKSPDEIMCSSSRMVVKRKDAETPIVLACTIIPYDDRFELGMTLRETARPVSLNHPHCAQFCVLGGASCSAKASEPTVNPQQENEPLVAAE